MSTFGDPSAEVAASLIRTSTADCKVGFELGKGAMTKLNTLGFSSSALGVVTRLNSRTCCSNRLALPSLAK
eukprot:CCRYP_018710-RC/>CCRYP_018710-RC protein AED:0.48 eAED:1.00 QI:0/0/0/1/0/0/2/0/70